MEILYNANVAYVLLIFGFVFALLALIAPGTGLLEVGGIFLLALAGLGIFRIGFNLWALIVLVLTIVPFVYAIRKPKREWALALSILGLIAGSLYLFPSGGLLPAVNPILAAVVSVLVAGFLWFTVRKVVAAHHARPLQDLQSLIGKIGEAKTRVQEEGTVQMAGELWSARSEKPIPAGSRVRVVSRQGFVLVVTLDEKSKK